MIWVVGKNASMATFPQDFFASRDSIGINQAAMIYKTRMAFTAYPYLIKEYLASGIAIENIIGVKPISVIPGREADKYPNYYPGIFNTPVYYDNQTRGRPEEVGAEMLRALQGDNAQPFHNDGTSLHLLLYWCAMHSKFPIRLCGCNQTRPCLDGIDHYHDQPAQEASRLYTEEMINQLRLANVDIKRYENYEEVQKELEL